MRDTLIPLPDRFRMAWVRFDSRLWQRFALVGVLALSAFLNLFRLTRNGDANLYYAAAVKSMLLNWHNFFFVSFDPGGFVTVDKPPVGFWIQTASAKLFGFHGWSMLLPQAVAGVLSVALLYALVRRAFGWEAGIIAALVLALMPISVATARNNTIDDLLVLTMLIAAWALIRAAERGSLGWLLLTFAIIGIGFNIKMLEAYLVLPAFVALYFFTAPRRWGVRIVHLALATVVLLVVSFSWAVAVDLTPAHQRPYVGSTTDNSEVSLAIGYNGLDRVLPGRSIFSTTQQLTGGQGTPDSATSAASSNAADSPANNAAFNGFRGGSFGTGNPGPMRLLNPALAGQIGWFVPFAALAVVVAGCVAVVRARTTRLAGMRRPVDRSTQGLILWGVWFVSMAAFFSVAHTFHSYYMVTLAPGIAAMTGIGVITLWRMYRQYRWIGLLLPVTLVAAAVLQISSLRPTPDWEHRLSPVITIGCLIAALVLFADRLHLPARWRPNPAVAVSIGIIALLIAPASWSAVTVWQSSPQRAQPVAGPNANPPFVASGSTNASETPLVSYLETHRDSDPFLLATLNASTAAPVILESGQPVMALGGFAGRDPILTANDVRADVANHVVRFFLFPQANAGRTFGGSAQSQTVQWVNEACARVPAQQWQTVPATTTSPAQASRGTTTFRGLQLYDCGQAR